VEGVISGSKKEWEEAFIGTAGSATAEGEQQVKARSVAKPVAMDWSRWKPSRDGSQRLSTGAADPRSATPEALPSKFSASRTLVLDLMGIIIKVDGDGLCWLYAFLASTRALQDPKNLTVRDYQVVRHVLNLLFDFVRDGGCAWMSAAESSAFLSTELPPYQGAKLGNYSGANVGYRVLASFTGISIIILDGPAMRTKELMRDGNLGRFGEC
jgi:hypothetical protein